VRMYIKFVPCIEYRKCKSSSSISRSRIACISHDVDLTIILPRAGDVSMFTYIYIHVCVWHINFAFRTGLVSTCSLGPRRGTTYEIE
jgi:hypothetical protein